TAASGTNDGELRLVAAENTSTQQRSAKIQVMSPNVSGSPFEVSVVQNGSPAPSLLVHPAGRSVAFPAGTAAFEVSNGGGGTLNWTAEVISDSPWLQIENTLPDLGDATLEVHYTENNGAQNRTGTVRISLV